MNAFEQLEQQIINSVLEKVKTDLVTQKDFNEKIEHFVSNIETLDLRISSLTDNLNNLKNNSGGSTGNREVTVTRIDPITQIETKDNLGHVHSRFDEALSMLQVRLAPVLVGPTGSTKTFVTKQLATALGMKNYVVKKLCRATAPHELIGYCTAQGTYIPGAFTEVMKNGGLIVLDELDAANENVILLAKDLRGRECWMPYGMQPIHPNCLVIATMNTWGQGATREYVGRVAQDAALFNEFCSLEWGYDQSLEEYIAHAEYIAYGGDDVKGLQRFINIFWRLRVAADVAKVRVIFGTRNLKHCAALLTRGYTFEYVLKACVFHGVKPEDILRIKKNIPPDQAIPEDDYQETIGTKTKEEKEQQTATNNETEAKLKRLQELLGRSNAENKVDGKAGESGSDEGEQTAIF